MSQALEAKYEKMAAGSPLALTGGLNDTDRIQLLDEVIGVPVVLGEEAERHSGDGVVAPGAVQAAEEVLAFLGERYSS